MLAPMPSMLILSDGVDAAMMRYNGTTYWRTRGSMSDDGTKPRPLDLQRISLLRSSP